MKDIQIAKSIKILPIGDIASQVGIDADKLEFYGKYKAKLPIELIDRQKIETSNLLLVSAITPTPAGEGKTTISIGLAQALNAIGAKTIAVLREPSLGPVFGIKGGAAGGGYSQVLPMEDINLHFTGDFSAIEKAHNLLAALIDNNLQSRSRSLGLDPRTIKWKRVMDMNDRALRNIIIGLGGTGQGVPRETGFDITAASEIMAIICLATSLNDLKQRIGNIFIGFTMDKTPIYARDLNAQGAMTALLKDAIKPNLVQTLEGGPAILHGGPFANIAQGTNSILATKMGLSLAPYVVTEAGFGADLGAEKFLNIKCRLAGLSPKVVIVVATIRALKHHGGVLPPDLHHPNANAVKVGLPNLVKHLENIALFGLNAVVAINKFPGDSPSEIETVLEACKSMGIQAAVADVFAQGGKGGKKLAEMVKSLADSPATKFKPIYDLESPVKTKISRIARGIYGARDVAYSAEAEKDLHIIANLGLSSLPICMAKTQYSFSDDPKKLGFPGEFVLTVRKIEIAAGAGFLIPLTGDTMRMPGLPAVPSAEAIDVGDDGLITGLF